MFQLNTLIDLIDGFQSAPTFDDRLTFAQTSLGDQGANGVNIGEIDIETKGLNWLASSYPSHWMELYAEQQYYEVDEVLLQGAITSNRITYDTGVMHPDVSSSSLRLEMDRNLYEIGFRSVLAQTFPGAHKGVRMGLSIAADSSLIDLGGLDHQAHFSRLAAITCEFIGAPDAASCAPLHRFTSPRLTPSEQDVLAYLAAGKLYGAISETLGITEVAVRKRMVSAKRKLGAATRDQAVALAVRDGLINI